MQTVAQFDEDNHAAVARSRRETGLGVSEAINHLVRRGLISPPETLTFKQQTYPLGLKMDVSNVAEALEKLEDPSFG